MRKRRFQHLPSSFWVESGLGLVLLLAAVHILIVLNQTTIKSEEIIEISVEKGSSFQDVQTALVDRGALAGGLYSWLAVKLMGAEAHLQAGDYQLIGPMDSITVLQRLVSGRAVLLRQTLIEGWTIHEMLEAMRQNPAVKSTAAPLNNLNFASNQEAEGWCLPDTYYHYRGDRDTKILNLCVQAMRETLARLWVARDPDLPYKTPREALTLASIIEAETGLDRERPVIAGALITRLRRGMRLQADPTLIYGLGPTFNRKLTRKHLRQPAHQNPYNTYRIDGLPPGPICNPSRESLLAALHPDFSKEVLYYVAVGDGSHYFSKTYEEHKKAINRYRLQRRRLKK